MENENFNRKAQKALEELLNSSPAQPICRETFRPEFNILGDVGEVKTVNCHLGLVDKDEKHWSDEQKKEREELLKQRLLPQIEKIHKEYTEEINAIIMEEIEKIKTAKKNIEQDLEAIRKKTGELEQLCAFIDKLFDQKILL